MKRNILSIFLASPNDLVEERKIIKETIDRMNKVIGRNLNWSIELLGWEDMLPGYARPQKLINNDVKACDLFIGILWKRWGSETKKYDSGFNEEFTIARHQRIKSNKPEIWLFFKNIDEDSLKDPGPQLRKVIDFKEKQIQLKELMFKEFNDADDWRNLISDDLYSYILGLQKNTFERISNEGSYFSSKKLKKRKSQRGNKEYPAETKNLIKKIASELIKNDEVRINYSETTRLFLQSSAWFSENCVNIIFGVHEQNIVYKNRKNWKLSFWEKWLLIRSFVNDNYNVCPGWYWLSKKKQNEVDEIISLLAEKDPNITVREMAFLLLENTRYKVSYELIKKGLSDKNRNIVLASIRLFGNSENIQNIQILNQVINSNDSTIRNSALSVKLELDFLVNPEHAFNEIIKLGIEIFPFISRTLEKLDLKIDESLLFKALKEGSPSIRKFAAQYLRKSKLIKKENAYELLEDTDGEVRKEGIFTLIDLKENIDIEKIKKLIPQKVGLFQPDIINEEIIPRILRLKTPEELLLLIDFYSGKSREAYRILVDDHFKIIEQRLRDDLDDEFETLKTDSKNKMIEKYGIDNAKKVLDDWEQNLVNYIKSDYISISLNGLIKYGKKGDIKYARKYLNINKSDSVIENSIRLISLFGDESDVDLLIKMAENANGNLQVMAINTSLKLSQHKDILLKSLFEKKVKTFTKTAAKYLSQYSSNDKLIMTQQLLFQKEEDIRLIGLAVLVSEQDSLFLEKLLDEYISNKKYYYNVVAYLDKCLYSPKRYREYFKSELTKTLNE